MYFLILFFSLFASGSLFAMQTDSNKDESSFDTINNGASSSGAATIDSFRLFYDVRTTDWIESPKKAYIENQNTNHLNQPYFERTLRHQLPLIMEKYLSCMIKKRWADGEIRLYMPGSLCTIETRKKRISRWEVKEKPFRNVTSGIYEIAYNPNTNVIFHRYFKQWSGKNKEIYPKKVFDAYNQTHEICATDRSSVVLDLETVSISPESIVEYENIKRADDKKNTAIVSTYQTTITKTNSAKYPIAKITIVDIAQPKTEYNMFFGHVPAEKTVGSLAE